MAAESGADIHHRVPRCLLGLVDAAAGGLAEWSEFDAEAERLSIEVWGLSREELTTLIKSATFEIPTTQHLRLHQEASDFVRWGRRGGRRTLALYGRPYFSLLPASDGGASDKKPLPGTVLVVQRGRVGATCLRVYNHSVRVHNRGRRRM